MGLDIYTKRDYLRFNWSGARAFSRWCVDQGFQPPFGDWNGGNGEDVSYKTNHETWEKFLEQFRLKYPDLAIGPAEAVQWAFYANEEDWELAMALAWSFIIAEALNNKEGIYFG